uniref:PE-PGRS family protein n=1 Tax=Parastrongyloides trichosuri TaxID=131310 RepID=A0A0N4Z3S6_PARTI
MLLKDRVAIVTGRGRRDRRGGRSGDGGGRVGDRCGRGPGDGRCGDAGLGPDRHPGQQRRHPARQELRQDDDGRLPTGGGRAPDGRRHLLQSGVGDHARPELRPHRHDHLVVGPVRQLRSGQLRRGQAGPGRADADPGHRGRQIRHQGQRLGPDGGDADDGGHPVRRGAEDAGPGPGQPRPAGPGQRGRPDARHPVRGRRSLRHGQHHPDAGRAHRRGRGRRRTADRALGRGQRPRRRGGPRLRLPAGGPGNGLGGRGRPGDGIISG